MRNLVQGKLAIRMVAIAVSLAMLVSSLGVGGAFAAGGPSAAPGDKMHPHLAKKADQNPNETVRVIVQGNNQKGELKRAIGEHGGKVTKNLALVHAYAAEMPAGKAKALAKRPNIKYVTIDAPMVATDVYDVSKLGTDYPVSANATPLWNQPISANGPVVAVLDSGLMSGSADFGAGKSKVIENVSVNGLSPINDALGHGTHISGIVASSGAANNGKYVGVNPRARLINVRVMDDKGMARVSDVIAGLQWAVANRAKYGIRIVNLALTSTVAESYLVSPLDAAVEMAWFSGITVVVAVGNLGANAILYPPANDPFVITVGATDTNLTGAAADDVVASFSSYGVTSDGVAKPEIAAPGRRIISNLAPGSALGRMYPERITDTSYMRLSGTSMVAAVVSGVAALIIEKHPDWKPAQVKTALVSTARRLATPGAGAGTVDAAAATSLTNPGYANSGTRVNLKVASLAGKTVYDAATWYDATWYDASWYDASWYDASWYDASWYDASWYDASWYDASWYDASWYDASWFDAAWFDAAWFDAAWFD